MAHSITTMRLGPPLVTFKQARHYAAVCTCNNSAGNSLQQILACTCKQLSCVVVITVQLCPSLSSIRRTHYDKRGRQPIASPAPVRTGVLRDSQQNASVSTGGYRRSAGAGNLFNCYQLNSIQYSIEACVTTEHVMTLVQLLYKLLTSSWRLAFNCYTTNCCSVEVASRLHKCKTPCVITLSRRKLKAPR